MSRSQFDTAEFIAWDGEGYTNEQGEHIYFHLANSKGNYIQSEHGLSTWECFTFLCDEAAKYKNAIHVCFGASYDVNMMFRDIDIPTMDRIWANDVPYGIDWHGCNISYQQRKKLSVGYCRRYKKSERTGKISVHYDKHITLWDVYPFFQTSFVKAIRGYLGDNYPDLAIIEAGKKERSFFTYAERESIGTYCNAELQTLVTLMNTLRDYLRQCDLHIQRWDGPGAIASALMRRYEVRKYYGSQHLSWQADIGTPLHEAIQHAYAGGRMELFQYGEFSGPIHHADINSAYPYAASRLPCLSCGSWKYKRGSRSSEVTALYHIRWNFPERMAYPFFYRETDGSISYPSQGEGWYWHIEILGISEQFYEVLECWEYITGSCEHKPFSFISHLYQQRQNWKAEGVGAEKVLKLGLNSIYGKLAQHVGSHNGIPPTYHNLAYAGMITAATRTMLYNAITDDTIMVATDGIYSTSLIGVWSSKELGDWEYTIHDALVVVQSGVYWFLDGTAWKSYHRGFDADSISIDKVRTGWREHEPTLSASSTRFVTYGSVTKVPDKSSWRKFKTIDRDLYLWAQGKRTDIVKRNGTKDSAQPFLQRKTRASRNITPGVISAPYPLPWQPRAREETIDDVPAETYLAEWDNV